MEREIQIQSVAHNEIDKKQWDHCIQHSPNGLIYAYSFYLDEMSPGWNALVMGDYEVVMPLTWKQKWGIRYLYQPFLAAQLGLFGKSISEKTIRMFLNSIPRNIQYIDVYLNEGNGISNTDKSMYARTNFLLELNKDYEAIRENYSGNVSRNIKKAEQLGCFSKTGIDETKVINLALSQMKRKDRNTNDNYKRFERLFKALSSRKMTETYGVFSKENELLSSCIFFYSHNRAYYILVGNDPAGRNTGSSHFLIDSFIKNNAGKNLILDFEGSDIGSLARFYAGFGANKVLYPGVKIDRLPWWIRSIRKIIR